MEVRAVGAMVTIVLASFVGMPAHSKDSPKQIPASSERANPCAVKQNPCAAKNPCSRKNPCVTQNESGIDPHQITRPADISLFSGVKRSVLVEEGRMLFEDSSLSSNGMSCNSCHATDNLFGASFATSYPHPFEMARERAGLDRAMYADEVVQFCLIGPMESQPLAWDSRELAALTAYVIDVRQKAFIATVRANPCGVTR